MHYEESGGLRGWRSAPRLKFHSNLAWIVSPTAFEVVADVASEHLMMYGNDLNIMLSFHAAGENFKSEEWVMKEQAIWI